MKKRILSAILLLVTLFCIFGGVVVYAADDAATELSLEEEIESNISGFDVDSFSAPRPVVVGCSPLIDYDSKSFYLYLYLYNPKKDYIQNTTLNLSFKSFSDSKLLCSKDIGNIQCTFRDKTADNRFYKLRINLASLSFDKYVSSANQFEFSWDRMIIYSSPRESITSSTSVTYYQNNKFSVSLNADGSSDVSFIQSEVAELDVAYTCYTTSATDGWNTRDQIHTVYFSIPDEYTELYPDLYSVSSTYTKKKTTPILIHNRPKHYIDYGGGPKYEDPEYYMNSYYVSTDYRYNDITTQGIYVRDQYASFGPDFDNIRDHFDFYLPGEYAYYFIADGATDYYVPVEEVFEYIENYMGDVDLFSSSEYFANSTKTVNMSWTSIPYVEQASFSDISSKYGFWAALKFWWYKESPEKLQEIAKNYAIDVNYDEILSTPQPYLFLVDDAEKKKINSYTDAYVSKTYLILEEDVPEFREYINTHDNVILYRFDISEHLSSELYIYEPNQVGRYWPDEESSFGFVEQYLYFDFQVIDVTFKRDGEYVSLNVISDKMNVGGDLFVPDDDIPPIIINPTPEDPDEVPQPPPGVNWSRIIIAVVSVILIIVALTWLIKIIVDISKIRYFMRKND